MQVAPNVTRKRGGVQLSSATCTKRPKVPDVETQIAEYIRNPDRGRSSTAHPPPSSSRLSLSATSRTKTPKVVATSRSAGTKPVLVKNQVAASGGGGGGGGGKG